MNYWKDIDHNLEELTREGFVRLPPLKDFFDIEGYADRILDSVGERVFVESCDYHQNFLNELNIQEELAPKLLGLAQTLYGYKGTLHNQYHIARKIGRENQREAYRAHFDSHLFTLVLPLRVPNTESKGSRGQLIVFPRLRRQPKSEIENFLGKLWYHQYASKKGIAELMASKESFEESFEDNRPLLFLGNTTFHTNREIAGSRKANRLTLLAHFFDPSPRYGIGGFLRYVRKR